jgi:hypothetical protein
MHTKFIHASTSLVQSGTVSNIPKLRLVRRPVTVRWQSILLIKGPLIQASRCISISTYPSILALESQRLAFALLRHLHPPSSPPGLSFHTEHTALGRPKSMAYHCCWLLWLQSSWRELTDAVIMQVRGEAVGI